MIDGNVIKFGYGTICVGNTYSHLYFQRIKPPQEVGASLIGKSFEAVQTVYFEFNDDFNKLLKSLDNLADIGYTVKFRDHVLDFSNYNHKSAAVVRNHVEAVIQIYTSCFAC